jgi:WD40 repeat protein
VGAAAQPVDHDGLCCKPFLVVDPGMHTAPINRVDSGSAGRFLVTGSGDKTVRVWSAEDGRLQRTIRVPAGRGHLGKIGWKARYFVTATSPRHCWKRSKVSPTGRRLGSGSATLQIWLADRVKKRSNGAQTPTTTIPFERFTNPVTYQVVKPAG